MKLIRLPMGCLSSRSTIAPADSVEQVTNRKNNNVKNTSKQNNNQQQDISPSDGRRNVANGNLRPMVRSKDNTTSAQKDAIKIASSSSGPLAISNNRDLDYIEREEANEDLMSIIMDDSTNEQERRKGDNGGDNSNLPAINRQQQQQQQQRILGDDRELESTNEGGGLSMKIGGGEENSVKKSGDGSDSFDDEPNLELFRQYVAVDYEITQLENKDALRVYHEKIEQLEQLERELDMISSEAEEVAVLSETDTQSDRFRSPSVTGNQQNDSKMMDIESNSLLSGATGSMSHKSWTPNKDTNAGGNPSPSNQRGSKNVNSNNAAAAAGRHQTDSKKVIGLNGGTGTGTGGGNDHGSQVMAGSRRFNHNLSSYSTVEEVFNRKIILEKERDKLKKEVEMVIIECDKLQQKYKKRDEILDKLFDGRTGNGLENHLEQQLNWLLEQKHYVDQVFYAWKRAETLTSQTCEQFASALGLLKKLPKIQELEQRRELAKSIESLLIKSRQDMEQAQKYNPNVDAPFFTDNETERFDKIIDIIISSDSISPSEYSQIMTVVQFAYKRAVSIRLWLEQILQTTIARDSFELAEEYKWIAIQLRKERINLIKSKLQDSPYHSMAHSVQEELARQQSAIGTGGGGGGGGGGGTRTTNHSASANNADTNNNNSGSNNNSNGNNNGKPQHEINRDSGVESETNDIDIEEEIYRLLELNKSRLGGVLGANTGTGTGTGAGENATTAMAAFISNSNGHTTTTTTISKQAANNQPSSEQKLKVNTNNQGVVVVSSSPDPLRDQMMRDRIQKRVKNGNQQLHLTQIPGANNGGSGGPGQENSTLPATPTKLRIELDEEARQSLLKQVDQIHSKHKNRIERLRGNTRAKATNSIMNRMQEARVGGAAVGGQVAAGSGPDGGASEGGATSTPTTAMTNELQPAKGSPR